MLDTLLSPKKFKFDDVKCGGSSYRNLALQRIDFVCVMEICFLNVIK